MQAGDPAGKSLEDTENAAANGHTGVEATDAAKAEQAAATQGSDLSATVTHESGSGISAREEGNGNVEKPDDDDVVVLSPISPFKANSQKARQTPKKNKGSNTGISVRTPIPEIK